MKRLLILLLLPIFLSCAYIQVDKDSKKQRRGVKFTALILIEQGYVSKEELQTIVEETEKLLINDAKFDVKKYIKKQIGYEDMKPIVKMSVQEFLADITFDVDRLIKDNTPEERVKQTLVVLGWVKDALKYY
jgi:hypothetical protein